MVAVVSAWWLERVSPPLAVIAHLSAACLSSFWAGFLLLTARVTVVVMPYGVAEPHLDVTRTSLCARHGERRPP
jgi:hypothetical protein